MDSLYDYKELDSYTIGTSVGCDSQPYAAYSACNGGTTSPQSFLDPINEYIVLSTYFVHQKCSVLNNTNIDTLFVTWERSDQLLKFIPRLRTDCNVGSVGRYIEGIANNITQTAIAIDSETMIGATIDPKQYILLSDHDPEVGQKVETLTKDDTVQKLDAYYNDTLDFRTLKGCVRNLNHVTVRNSILRSYSYSSPVVTFTKRQLKINTYVFDDSF